MNPSELRSGNYVTYEEEVYEVEWIYCSKPFNPEDYQPIPLTEGWMLGFAFERYPWGWVRKTKGDKAVLVCQSKDKYWIEIGNGLRIDLPYVHTLQNFFVLTGGELTITP
jgi:hypothetical protein